MIRKILLVITASIGIFILLAAGLFYLIVLSFGASDYFSVDGVDFEFIELVRIKPYECVFYKETDTLNLEKTNGIYFELEKKYHRKKEAFSIFSKAHAAKEPGIMGTHQKMIAFEVYLLNTSIKKSLDISKQLYIYSNLIDMKFYEFCEGCKNNINQRSGINCRNYLDEIKYEEHDYRFSKSEDGKIDSSYNMRIGTNLDKNISSIENFIDAFNGNERATKGISNGFHFLIEEDVPIDGYHGMQIKIRFDDGVVVSASRSYSFISSED